MMKKKAIFHLVNNLADSSITRIIYHIIRSANQDEFVWYVGSISKPNDMEQTFSELGTKCLKYDQSTWEKYLRADIERLGLSIIHSHTPRTALTAWRVMRNMSVSRRPLHINTKHLFTHPFDRRLGLIYSMVDWYSLYLPDRIVPVSLTMAKKLRKITFGLKRKITPIPNGIATDLYSDQSSRQVVRDEFLLPQNAFVFGYTGRIDQVKRLDILFAAFQSVFSKYPNSRLLIVGEGQMKEQWMNLARELQIEKAVIWAGFRHDIARMMSAMDVYIQPSDNEGLSLSILEAMAAHRPVIATKVGAAQEVITHMKNGCLIDRGSTDQLIRAMKNSIENPSILEAMANEAFNTVSSEYSIGKMTEAYLSLYRSLSRGNHHA